MIQLPVSHLHSLTKCLSRPQRLAAGLGTSTSLLIAAGSIMIMSAFCNRDKGGGRENMRICIIVVMCLVNYWICLDILQLFSLRSLLCFPFLRSRTIGLECVTYLHSAWKGDRKQNNICTRLKFMLVLGAFRNLLPFLLRPLLTFLLDAVAQIEDRGSCVQWWKEEEDFASMVTSSTRESER